MANIYIDVPDVNPKCANNHDQIKDKLNVLGFNPLNPVNENDSLHKVVTPLFKYVLYTDHFPPKETIDKAKNQYYSSKAKLRKLLAHLLGLKLNKCRENLDASYVWLAINELKESAADFYHTGIIYADLAGRCHSSVAVSIERGFSKYLQTSEAVFSWLQPKESTFHWLGDEDEDEDFLLYAKEAFERANFNPNPVSACTQDTNATNQENLAIPLAEQTVPCISYKSVNCCQPRNDSSYGEFCFDSPAFRMTNQTLRSSDDAVRSKKSISCRNQDSLKYQANAQVTCDSSTGQFEGMKISEQKVEVMKNLRGLSKKSAWYSFEQIFFHRDSKVAVFAVVQGGEMVTKDGTEKYADSVLLRVQILQQKHVVTTLKKYAWLPMYVLSPIKY